MVITPDTKIASILKENARALDAIISISPRFEKLKNPLLRRLMAGRTSLATASKIGGCTLDDFYSKLKPLGFLVDQAIESKEETEEMEAPEYLKHLGKGQLVSLDVRPVLNSGTDPLTLILEKIKGLEKGQVLEIINSFAPTPLINLLRKKGFDSYVEYINDQLVQTYFYKSSELETDINVREENSEDWDYVLKRFENNMERIDVRMLEMPGPMMKILGELETLPGGKALFVYHKRIPLFLLPELADRKMEYRIKKISDQEVHLLIFKD